MTLLTLWPQKFLQWVILVYEINSSEEINDVYRES